MTWPIDRKWCGARVGEEYCSDPDNDAHGRCQKEHCPHYKDQDTRPEVEKVVDSLINVVAAREQHAIEGRHAAADKSTARIEDLKSKLLLLAPAPTVTPEAGKAELDAAWRVISILSKGIVAIRDLINSSHGVYGLHLNGDGAPWDSLESGGSFGEWLHEFNEAEDAVKKIKDAASKAKPEVEPDRKPIGMYGNTPRVKVGKYSICRQDDASVWIEEDGKDGGQFPDEHFEKCIEAFYNENL